MDSHSYVLPPVAVRVRDGVVQLITEPFEELMFTTGKVMFSVMLLLDVLVQPFAPVTVTVYVPGVVTLSAALTPKLVVPLLQE